MEKLTLLTTNMEIYRHPRHVPGYLGYTPQIKFTYGETFGNTTGRWFQDYRAATLNTSKERMGRGGDKFLPFPTYYTNNPDHVLGARTRSRDRWQAAPKYKLFNVDGRDVAIKKYDKAAQRHREHYKDRTETVPPVRLFILPNVFHDTKSRRIPAAGRTKNEERALAYANQVYRTTRNKPLAKSNVEERRIRDVFFEQR